MVGKSNETEMLKGDNNVDNNEGRNGSKQPFQRNWQDHFDFNKANDPQEKLQTWKKMKIIINIARVNANWKSSHDKFRKIRKNWTEP